jgi:hypothetical protein
MSTSMGVGWDRNITDACCVMQEKEKGSRCCVADTRV